MATPDTESGLPPLHVECGPCEGHGVVTAPAWLAYDARCKQARQEWLAANPGKGWYSSPEGSKWEDGYPEVPEVRCGDCDGTGYQMTAAGRELLFFLAVHRKG
jgi:hypothetical protein